MANKDKNDEKPAVETSSPPLGPAHDKKEFNKKYVQFFKEIQKKQAKDNAQYDVLHPKIDHESTDQTACQERYVKRRMQREKSQKRLAALYSLKGHLQEERKEPDEAPPKPNSPEL